MSEIRFYKGKYKVEVMLKSKGNYRVKALETVRITPRNIILEGASFVTVPRLLWRHPRK